MQINGTYLFEIPAEMPKELAEIVKKYSLPYSDTLRIAGGNWWKDSSLQKEWQDYLYKQKGQP